MSNFKTIQAVPAADGGDAATLDGHPASDFLKRPIPIALVAPVASIATGNGKAYYPVTAAYDGALLTGVHAKAVTAGATNGTTFQITRIRAGNGVSMLSTVLTIDSGETDSSDATPAVIDADNDDLATGDWLRIDVPSVSTTPPKGIVITLEITLP